LRLSSSTGANTQNFTTTEISSGSSRVEVTESGVGIGNIALGSISRVAAGGTVDFGQPTAGVISTTSTNINGILGGFATVNGVTFAKADGTGKIVGLADADYDSGAFAAAKNFDTHKNAGGTTDGGAVNSLRFGRASADVVTLNANLNVGSGGILVGSAVGANDSTITSTSGETLTSGNGLDLAVIQNNVSGSLSISPKITGAIALTKSGPGKLILGNSGNDYDGGTFINAGTIEIQSDGALGHTDGGITFAASSLGTAGVLSTTSTMTLSPTRAITLNSGGGAFNVATGTALTVTQGITGDGGLGKLGAGTLILNGDNSYTGETVIYAGSLQLAGAISSTAAFTADGNVITAGSTIAASGPFQIARLAGANVSLFATASTLSGTEFTIGGEGNATVTLSGASLIAASCDLVVAKQNGSTSVLHIQDSEVSAQEDMIIGAAGGANGTANITNGKLGVTNTLFVGANGGTGTLNLAGTEVGSYGVLEVGFGATGTLNISDSATLTGSTAANMGHINVGRNNPGLAVVNQSGGAVNFSSWMTIGIEGGSNDPANSKYAISGGTLSSTAGIEIGSDHGGTLEISAAGDVNIPNVSIGTYGNRGSGTAGNGLLKMTGGTLTTNAISVGDNRNAGGITSNGVFTQSGGTVQLNGQLVIARSADGAGTTGTANLNGGTLNVNSIVKGAGNGQLNFNGTVIKPNASNGAFITGFDTTNSEVLSGGAIFDTNGKVIRVDTSLDGVGALTKDGTGKLIIGGASSFAGGVNLDSGTLSVRNNTALGTGPVIGNGGILAFDNSTGPGLIEGRISSTNAFDTTTAIPFDAVTLGTPKAHTTDQALFGYNSTWGYRGSLVVPAGPNVTWSFAEQFDDSVFLSIDGNTLLNDGTWNNPTVATVTLAPGEHTFELRLGQGGGGVGPNNGWGIGFGIDTLGRGTTNPGDYTALTDPGNGTILKYNDDGGVDYTVANPFTLQATTEIHVRQFGATLTGDIAGASGLTKTGDGRLTLTGTNSYAGGTTISSGVLEIGNGGATGSLGGGVVANSGTLKFNRTGTLSVPNAISGTGSLEQNGTGTTVLSGASTYTGATVVNAGTLQVSGSISGSSLTTVRLGGTLSGTGSVGALLVDGGTIAPGASPGILSAGNTTFNGGTFSLEINGTTAGSLYDQLNVAGTVTLQSNTALAVNFGYTPGYGDTFTIINNDGADSVLGGGLFTVGGNPLVDNAFYDLGNGLSISVDYSSGTDGNDVTLSVIPEPASVSMVLGGLAVLVGIRRRRR
jgi:autotransporter-associated beta strand protein